MLWRPSSSIRPVVLLYHPRLLQLCYEVDLARRDIDVLNSRSRFRHHLLMELGVLGGATIFNGDEGVSLAEFSKYLLQFVGVPAVDPKSELAFLLCAIDQARLSFLRFGGRWRSTGNPICGGACSGTG